MRLFILNMSAIQKRFIFIFSHSMLFITFFFHHLHSPHSFTIFYSLPSLHKDKISLSVKLYNRVISIQVIFKKNVNISNEACIIKCAVVFKTKHSIFFPMRMLELIFPGVNPAEKLIYVFLIFEVLSKINPTYFSKTNSFLLYYSILNHNNNKNIFF
jgi:hypothetical protein